MDAIIPLSSVSTNVSNCIQNFRSPAPENWEVIDTQTCCTYSWSPCMYKKRFFLLNIRLNLYLLILFNQLPTSYAEGKELLTCRIETDGLLCPGASSAINHSIKNSNSLTCESKQSSKTLKD